MISLNKQLLDEAGFHHLLPDEINRLLATIYEDLEMRVGMVLAGQMSDEQLSEFEAFIDSDDTSGAQSWLEKNFPTYKDLVHEELNILKGELQRDAGRIMDRLVDTV